MGDAGVIGEGGSPTALTVCVRGSNTFRDVEVSDTMLVVGVGGAKSGSGFRAASDSRRTSTG
jgi:hypothetical protein